jgi:type I restriction enzyme S subunit
MNKKLPIDWQIKKLGEVCKITYGKGLSTKELKDSGFPVFGANGVIGFNDKYLYKESQVLISCRGAYSGKINISPPLCYVTNNSLILEIFNEEEMNKKFLFYILHTVNKTKLVTGTAQPQVTINNAVELTFSIPKIETQTLIVSKIEELFSELDKGIEDLKTAQLQLKTYRQSVLKWAFEGKLTNENVKDGELPEFWEMVDMSKVIEKPKYGTSKKCDYGINGFGVLRIPNIAKGIVDSSDLKFAKFDEKDIETYSLKEGDILTIRSNGSVDLVGKCALISKKDEGYLYAGYLIRLRPIMNKVNPKYLINILTSIDLRNQIEDKAKSTSGVNNINSEELSTLKIQLPPLEEQHLIVQEIESRLSVADKMEESIEQSLQQAEALRQSILKKAFSGELI